MARLRRLRVRNIAIMENLMTTTETGELSESPMLSIDIDHVTC